MKIKMCNRDKLVEIFGEEAVDNASGDYQTDFDKRFLG